MTSVWCRCFLLHTPQKKIPLDPNQPMFFTLINFSSLSIFGLRLWEKEFFNSAQKKEKSYQVNYVKTLQKQGLTNVHFIFYIRRI